MSQEEQGGEQGALSGGVPSLRSPGAGSSAHTARMGPPSGSGGRGFVSSTRQRQPGRAGQDARQRQQQQQQQPQQQVAGGRITRQHLPGKVLGSQPTPAKRKASAQPPAAPQPPHKRSACEAAPQQAPVSAEGAAAEGSTPPLLLACGSDTTPVSPAAVEAIKQRVAAGLNPAMWPPPAVGQASGAAAAADAAATAADAAATAPATINASNAPASARPSVLLAPLGPHTSSAAAPTSAAAPAPPHSAGASIAQLRSGIRPICDPSQLSELEVLLTASERFGWYLDMACEGSSSAPLTAGAAFELPKVPARGSGGASGEGGRAKKGSSGGGSSGARGPRPGGAHILGVAFALKDAVAWYVPLDGHDMHGRHLPPGAQLQVRLARSRRQALHLEVLVLCWL